MAELALRHLYEAQQLTQPRLQLLFERADHFRHVSPQDLQGKILVTLFYEPSTRTRLSFESAMTRLGGQVLSTENAKDFSSAIKGESLEDTIRVIDDYGHAIVMRHHEEGAAKKAAEVSTVPIINAGDGKGQHPTQALLDAYTIQREIRRTNDVKLAMVGDLASGRTVRSLAYLLGRPGLNNQFYFVSPPHLRMGDDIKEWLRKNGTAFTETDDLSNVLPEADIFYMTRIQKERMDTDSYEKAKGKFVINEETLKLVKPHARILHPLPHVEEIALPLEIEQNDPRVAYFRQAENGLYVRMALLHHMLHD